MPHNQSVVFFNNLNQGCVAGQTQESNAPMWNVGSYVWTLFDYYGEPGHWPHISSSFGSFDLAGFPKAPVWWYRSWWLANISASDAGRPPLPNTAVFIRIVESWQAPASGLNRSIHVYSNAPLVSLELNGLPGAGGPLQAMGAYGLGSFSVPYAAGNLTAVAWDTTGTTVLGVHSTFSWGAPAAIVLSLDAPSLATGTGSAVYLDGEDVAAVRATVVDTNGHTVRDAEINVSFSVSSGPGVIWATGNGDPANQESNALPSRTSYHGLVRCIVRAALVVAESETRAALLKLLNPEAGTGPHSARISGPLGGAATGSAGPPIVITASAPGLPTATLSIATSTDPVDSVMAVAAASVGVAYTGE